MPIEALAWLLAAQLLVGLGELALLGFLVYRARALMNTLARTAAGTEWKTDQMAQAFTSAATSIELSATAAWNASVACQAIARDVRPLAHAQSDEQPTVTTVDLNRLELDQDT